MAKRRRRYQKVNKVPPHRGSVILTETQRRAMHRQAAELQTLVFMSTPPAPETQMAHQTMMDRVRMKMPVWPVKGLWWQWPNWPENP